MFARILAGFMVHYEEEFSASETIGTSLLSFSHGPVAHNVAIACSHKEVVDGDPPNVRGTGDERHIHGSRASRRTKSDQRAMGFKMNKKIRAGKPPMLHRGWSHEVLHDNLGRIVPKILSLCLLLFEFACQVPRPYSVG